jgi:hypothetical protein
MLARVCILGLRAEIVDACEWVALFYYRLEQIDPVHKFHGCKLMFQAFCLQQMPVKTRNRFLRRMERAHPEWAAPAYKNPYTPMIRREFMVCQDGAGRNVINAYVSCNRGIESLVWLDAIHESIEV